MPLVSVLLPSIRETLVKEALEELSEAEPNLDYEVLVASPFYVTGPRVVWVSEHTFLGPTIAAYYAYKYSTGKYIVTWAEDLCLTEYCITDTLKLLQDRESTAVAFNLPSNSHFYIYNLLYARWGIYPKELLERAGGFVHSCFRYDWGDADLGLRIHEVGGSIVPGPINSYIDTKPEILSSSLELRGSLFISSTEEFLDRWHSKYGGDIPREEVFRDLTCINVGKETF